MSSNKLDHIVQALKNEKLDEIPLDPNLTREIKIENLNRLQEGMSAVDTAVKKVEEKLLSYASMVDNENGNENDLREYESYYAKAETSLAQALDLKILLEARHNALIAQLRPQVTLSSQSARIGESVVQEQPVRERPVELPPVPIPSFDGDIWEWDRFWEIFNHNINSQPIPEMIKFNYLLKALKGEAKESISKFQVTGSNYAQAISFLKTKYSNKEALVNHLIEKLDSCTVRTSSIKGQRSLLEQLQTIITQLQQKGENVSSSWLIKKVIAKFPEPTRRRVITKRQTLSVNDPFTMEHLFKYIEEVLSTEEMILRYTDKAPVIPNRQDTSKNGTIPIKKGSCMYCRGSHPSNGCTQYATPRERARYLRENKLCAICASSAHRAQDCKGRMCFKCNGAHHTSCCFSSKNIGEPPKAHNQSSVEERTAGGQSQGSRSRVPKKGIPPKIRSNIVTTSGADSVREQHSDALPDEPPLPPQTVLSAQFSRRPHLPTGELTVINPRTRSLTKVDVLLDTGAEISFVSSAIAQELDLPVLEQRLIRLNTFGSAETKERMCKLVRMEAWDSDGTPHSLELLTYDLLTHPFEQPYLSVEDENFIESSQIPVKLNKTRKVVRPVVLLGCDLLWSFIRNDAPMVQLPSGLHILPTKLGCIITGKTNNPKLTAYQVTRAETNKICDLEQWEMAWSMNTVHTPTSHPSESEISQEEKEKWENYWTMDKTGAEEFQGPQKEAQDALDRKIWDSFNSTIEKRQNGYYVRLPWKDYYPPLPDNRALAYKRLANVWTALKEKGLVEQYDTIFQEQLDKNIVELVDEKERTEGSQIHYIPHQPVITPQKSTTKMRIVFDASAHYKGSPSLNDSLHRGPVILPPLHGLLLRFRVGTIALVSDVEKAFLQVRLHESDRDATRCMWLQDPKKPPSSENLMVLRFTRVTFGVKSSPFLLAGTLHYHLDHCIEESLAQEIKQNLYVDNLLFTANSYEESVEYYNQAKKIFRDMNMNLREFNSNDVHLMETIANSDKTESTNPKVLGIRWETKSDTLTAVCSLPNLSPVTKRTVTSAIATIYDPMGWFVPMMHPARVFLQSLWKDEYDWNTILPEGKTQEWQKIRINSDGFLKNLPRQLVTKGCRITLATFADASTNGMTACTYICHQGDANLLMAKAKLPSIHSKATVPKLELNALTLAMRLTNFVVSHLESVTKIQEIYLFSDSKIVLGWLKSEPSRDLGQFIYNRLTEIRRIMTHLVGKGYTIHFGYVASEENPADCGTRGITKEDFLHHSWWTGPSWLRVDCEKWPAPGDLFGNPEDEKGEEIMGPQNTSKQVLVIGPPDYDPELIKNGQLRTLTQAKRTVAHVIRFIRANVSRINARRETRINLLLLKGHSNWVPSTCLSGEEVQEAGKIIIRAHQNLRVTNSIIRSLKDLNIQYDDDGLLRCYGRLGRSQLGFDAKYPVFILQKTILAELIIRECHERGHPGINHTMSLVRQEFWIPHLRSQVQQLIRKCLKCQKFNNLPYKYPYQDDLPEERVIRSQPFEHVGLDYFGPLTIAEGNDKQEKCYGVIITCAVTRLLHLDVVYDLSTVAFLHMMRRFFARRGIPRIIICDNAPTFTLGEAILNDSIHAAQNDPMVSRELSNRGIEWRHITPYAPWQGGFYERLVKSVKHSLYKTLGTTLVTFEELSTVIVEIESILNTRPLTYTSTDLDNTRMLRPIDFLQRDVYISPYMSSISSDQDPEYIPPEQLNSLQTRRQAIAALERSCKISEKFWKIWQKEYLTSLREKHVLSVGRGKGSAQEPRRGAVVLICEATLPRHSWKMGIIQDLVANAKGIVREGIVRLPSHRLIRRPINLLVPLELDDDPAQERKNTVENRQDSDPIEAMRDPSACNATPKAESNQDENRTVGSRYNLRQRRKVDYNEANVPQIWPMQSLTLLPILMQIIAVLLFLCISTTVAVQENSSVLLSTRNIRCIKGGVKLQSEDRTPYEICGDQYCITFDAPQVTEYVNFPPDVVLHNHKVRWKFLQAEMTTTVETLCPAAPFCEAVKCTFCSANILNPECWPISAIFAMVAIIYFVVTGCYVFLYVPLVIGRPLRLIAAITWMSLRGVSRLIKRFFFKNDLVNRRRRLAEVLAILGTVLQVTYGCQLVDVFDHHSTMCTNTPSAPCQVHLSEVLKISAFKQEACIRLSHNGTMMHEIRLTWKSLDLLCEPVTDLFTRDTMYKIVDSKRCAHKGSCRDEKCGSINTSSLLEELEEGNRFPGKTNCIESCGGLGCGCLSLSSGCLLYRIYLVPVSEVVYEIFHCARWREAAKIRISHTDGTRKAISTLTTSLVPNISKKWNALSFTLTSLSMPPMFLLNTPFIMDEHRTAIWSPNARPALQCQTYTHAQNLTCAVVEDCNCRPAETRMNCDCRDFSVAQWFKNIKKQLPATFNSLTFQRHGKLVVARVSNMVTSEIVMNFEGDYEPTLIVDDAMCKIKDSMITGCYNCAKGAVAHVSCVSSRDNLQAEIVCGDIGFSVLCNTTGRTSTLRFSLSEAQVSLECSVSCGKLSTKFELQGILKFTGSVTGMIEQWLEGHPISHPSFAWPDVFHIAIVFLQWYKTLIAALVGLVLLLGFTYIILSTFGLRMLLGLLQIAKWLILLTPRIVIAALVALFHHVRKIRHNKQH